MRKFFFLIIFLYILALMESSFFIHFRILDGLPSFILISQILISLFEDPKENRAIFSAFVAGALGDIFSERPIGLSLLILVSLSFLIKKTLREYVRIPALTRF